MWDMAYSIPNHEEMGKILTRRSRLVEHHRKFYKKMNDIRSAYSNSRVVSKEFCKWVRDTYGITNLDAVLYLFFMTVSMDTKDNKYDYIREWLDNNGFVLDNRVNTLFSYKRFSTIESAIRWVIAYRYVIKHFSVLCKSLPIGSDRIG